MKIITGNIFTTKCQTIVNTVNTIGIMGAGIALEFKFRYPEMFEKYKLLCESNSFTIGMLWLYKYSAERYILNFPTKINWKYPTKEEYLIVGLEKFIQSYVEKGIESIAYPLLGASKGGLSQNRSLEIMGDYLETCEIPIEIYLYDPNAPDDLYQSFISKLKDYSIEDIIVQTKIKRNILSKLFEVVDQDDVKSISQLAHVKGIGLITLEKVFDFCVNKTGNSNQKQLDLGLF